MSGSDIVFFLSEISDSSIPLELAAALDQSGRSIEVCSLFPSDTHSFDVSIQSLEASSNLDVRPYTRFYAYLQNVDPTVLHIHPNVSGAIARIIANLVGVPVVVTTEHSVHSRFSRLKNLINGGTNWLNDAVIANSFATAKEFRWWERGLLTMTGTPTQVIHNGICHDTIPKSKELQTEDVVIGTVGRLVDVKNYEQLIVAVAPLLGDGTSLVIVGDGPNRQALEDVAAHAGVSSDVVFTGSISREEVYDRLAQFDIFAFPSHAEGFGVAVVEAMSAGLPPVVSDIPALREVVGDAGSYVDPQERSDIQSTIQDLLEDTAQRQQLGNQARNRARALFSLENSVESHEQLYDALVSQ